MLLHFLHAVTNDRDRVHVFLFGTRLTNVTRHLRRRDVEVAFEIVSRCPTGPADAHRRRTGDLQPHLVAARAGQGAVVLLITDGLDRDGAEGLADDMDRLRRSCRG